MLGIRKKEEGRRKKDEGRRKKDEGRRKNDEGIRFIATAHHPMFDIISV
jgi:hypothetical protein